MNGERHLNPGNDGAVQKVRFEGRDDFHTAHLSKSSVDVEVSKSMISDGRKGSSCVKVSQVVSCVWDKSFLHGKQVAVDRSRTYLAYGIKLPKGGGGSTAVRVVDIQSQKRNLVRGLRGVIRDLSFSHHPTRTMLAVIDEQGTLSVTEILKNDNSSTQELGLQVLLHVERDVGELPTPYNRVIWCGYVPEADVEDSADDPAYLLFVSRNESGELWNVSITNEKHGSHPIRVSEVNEGFCELKMNGQITDATFSPDGSALAVASTNGLVKFFEIQIDNLRASYEPKVLHEWLPHQGKPVTFVEFLDNLVDHTQDTQYWKFAITGGCDNTELKVWSCDNWECHQTVRFTPENDKDHRLTKPLQLNVGIDLTRKFIVLSDIDNSVVYVGEIADNGSVAKISCLTELLFAIPVISFAIYNVTGGDREEKEYESFSESTDEVELHLFIVQEKALSDCIISYSRIKEGDNQLVEVEQVEHVREESPDVAIEEPIIEREQEERRLQDIQPPNLLSDEAPISLMTPYQVASPGKAMDGFDSYLAPPRPPSQQLSAFSPLNADLVTSTLKAHTPPVTQSTASDLLNFAHTKKLRSGTSSPSREVASILDQGIDAFRRMSLEEETPTFEAQPRPSARSPISDLLHGGSLPTPLAPIGNLVSVAPPPSQDQTNNISIPQNNNVMDILADVIHGIQSPQLAPAAPIASPSRWQPNAPSPPLPDLARRESPVQTGNVRDLENLVSNALRGLEAATRRLDSIQTNQDALRGIQNQIQALREEQKSHNAEMAAFRQALRMENFEKRIEDAVCKQIANYQEALTLAVSQTVASSVPARIENHVKTLLAPAVARGLEPIRQVVQQELESLCESNRRSLDKEVIKRMSNLENTMKEHITKLVQSKELANGWSQGIIPTTQAIVQSAFKDVAQHQLIPSYDRACQQMFYQMNDTMTKGLKEIIQSAEAQVAKQKTTDEAVAQGIQAVLGRLNNLADSLPAKLTPPLATLLSGEVSEQMAQAITRSSAQFAQRISESVRDEISRAVREQHVAIEQNVRAMTPAPSTIDMTVLLSTLIAQSRYNEAFERVLALTNLDLVMFVCERVDPGKLFGMTPCPVKQPVLLSLIQQLSANLKKGTDLKLRYLEEAVIVVDKSDPVISNHIGMVKDQVRKALETLQGSEFAGRAKRLSMVVASQM